MQAAARRGAHEPANIVRGNRQIESLVAIDAWAKKTTDGSLSTLPLLPEPGVWDEVKAEHGNCLGKQCEHFDACHWQAAKRRMNTGNILVVNHALFFSDLALRSAGVQYLPKYDAVIFDEAHTIEDVAGQHFAVKLSETSLRYQLRQLYDPRKGRGVLALQGKLAEDAITAVTDAGESASVFFDECAIWQQEHGRSNGRVNRPDIVQTDLGDRLNDVAKLIRAMLKEIKAPETVLELTSKADRLAIAAQTVDVLLKQQMPDAVYWIDTQKQRAGNRGGVSSRVTLSAAPVDVSAGLRMHLLDRTRRVVMTSATLCTARAIVGSVVPRSMGVPPMPRREGSIDTRRGAKLPHWTAEGASYAVTFRLADAIPAERVEVPQSLRERHANDPQAYMAAVDALLEENRGECILRQPVARVDRGKGNPALSRRAVSSARMVGDAEPRASRATTGSRRRPIQDLAFHKILHRPSNQRGDGPQRTALGFGILRSSQSRDAVDLANQVQYAFTNPERAFLEDWAWSGRDDEAINAVLAGRAPLPGGHERDAHATSELETAPVSHDTRPRVPAAFQYIARRLGVTFADTVQLGSAVRLRDAGHALRRERHAGSVRHAAVRAGRRAEGRAVRPPHARAARSCCSPATRCSATSPSACGRRSRTSACPCSCRASTATPASCCNASASSTTACSSAPRRSGKVSTCRARSCAT